MQPSPTGLDLAVAYAQIASAAGTVATVIVALWLAFRNERERLSIIPRVQPFREAAFYPPSAAAPTMFRFYADVFNASAIPVRVMSVDLVLPHWAPWRSALCRETFQFDPNLLAFGQSVIASFTVTDQPDHWGGAYRLNLKRLRPKVVVWTSSGQSHSASLSRATWTTILDAFAVRSKLIQQA